MKKLIFLALLFIPFLNYGQTNSFDVTKGTIRSHLRMVPNASPPSGVLIGTLYFDTDSTMYYFDGVQWKTFGGDSYWTLSADTLGAIYNVRLDSAFLMKFGNWYTGFSKEDTHDDNADSLVMMGYSDYEGSGMVSTIEVRHDDSGADDNYYNYLYVSDGSHSSTILQTDSSISITADTTKLLSTHITVPNITALPATKFAYIAGIDIHNRLFPHPLAATYNSLVRAAIDSSRYGKENVLDVGGASEIYSDFSTAVAGASAGDVIELSNATFTESGTVTMPTGSTLKIYEGGLLTGTFTLVGDNTRLDAGLYQCFGSGVTITGTWIAEKTYVDWFGMVGAADEGGELTAAINFCKLTTGKTLVFQSRTYYVENFITYWAGGGTIEGNNAVIKITYNSATEYEEALRIYGSVGTYDTLSTGAFFGSYIMEVPAGSPLLSLNRGDMVKIISDASPDGTTNLHGEIKIVDTVIASGRNVKFTEPLYSSYFATDYARMAEVTPGKAVIKDLTIIGLPGRNYNLGIELKYIDKPLVQNVKLENFKYSAFGFQDCFAGRFDVVANNAMGSTGLGYGVALYGASMSNVITVRGFSMRHITATGGNGSQGGIPYNNLFVDCIGTGVYAHAYDLHKACGSGNKYVNCRASAGVAIADTANFQGVWSAAVTYDNNDIVTVASSDTSLYQLYKSTQNSNTNHSPNTDKGSYWEVYNNAIYGFYVGCNGATIENCQVEGFHTAFNTSNIKHRNIRVDGLKAINCRYGVAFNADTIYNSSFNNIQLLNQTFKDDAYIIYLGDAILDRVSFSNITGKGAFAFFISNTTFTDKKLEVNSIVADGLAEISAQTPEVHINVGSAFLTQQSTPGYVLNTASTSNGVKSINVQTMTVQGAAARPVLIGSRLNSLSFGNVYLTDGSTATFIDNNDSIDRCKIDYIYNDGSGGLDVLDNTSAYCGTLNVGNMAGTLNGAPWYSGNFPTTINAGVNGFVDAIDFAAANLYAGWIKQNGHFLINTCRTNNLGLGYDAVTNRGVLDYNSSTAYNTGIGYQTLWDLDPSAAAQSNTAVGSTALYAMTIGDDNTAVGRKAGELITSGVQNTLIGSNAGAALPGGSDRNVMIGYAAGSGLSSETDDKLYIDNSNTATPLIGGDFSANTVTINGALYVTVFAQLTPTADPPASAAEGMIYADTDHHLYYYNGSTWVQLDN